MNTLGRFTFGEDGMVDTTNAETLIQMKEDSKCFHDTQMTLAQTTDHLDETGITQISRNHDMGEGVYVVKETETQAKKEKDATLTESVDRALEPSVPPQNRFDEMQSEHTEHSGDWIYPEEIILDQEALGEASKGQTEMLRQYLSGISASIKDAEDADDFNVLLMWVAFAKRPMTLGELDALLCLTSPEGRDVSNLESKLRGQFASLFLLTREDGLTTSDLQSLQMGAAERAKDARAGDVLDVGEKTRFKSDPTKTTVSFAHAAILEFFRDGTQGKISAGGDAPAIGAAPLDASLSIAKMCLSILMDDTLLKGTEYAVSLRDYAMFWKEHLDVLPNF